MFWGSTVELDQDRGGTVSDCIFCKIVDGKIPSTKVFENEKILGFKDISPQAPTHFVFVPKNHITSLAETQQEHKEILGELLWALSETAQKQGVAESGFRTVINTNSWGGQTVFHLHAHLLAGKRMGGGMTGV